MKCPFCDAPSSNVRDSREIENGKSTRRRRECQSCKRRFTTFEKIQIKNLFVIKRSGIKKPFDAQKIAKSIETALRKRKHKAGTVENLVEHITSCVENSNQTEITSRAIGKMIMQELLKIDHVAYIRFASVYHDFTNAQDFAKFINNIIRP